MPFSEVIFLLSDVSWFTRRCSKNFERLLLQRVFGNTEHRKRAFLEKIKARGAIVPRAFIYVAFG